MQQERAGRIVRHGPGQQPVGIAAGRHLLQRQGPHRRDQMRLRVPIGHWRDIRDDQFAHDFRVLQRQHHRGLPAHGMSDHVGTCPDRRRQIIGHVGIGVTVGPGAFPVVAHVHRGHREGIAQPLDDHPPVSRRPVKPVRDHEGWTLALRHAVERERAHAGSPEPVPAWCGGGA